MKKTVDRRQLMRVIAERFPAAWDAIIPHGPAVGISSHAALRDDAVSLSSQPIPPGGEASLNPQPLPPRWYGELIGTEILRAAWLGQLLGVDLPSVAEWDDIPFCGTVPKRPPFPKGPFPHIPDNDDPPVYFRDYYLGLAGALATADGRLAESPVVKEGFELALDRLGSY